MLSVSHRRWRVAVDAYVDGELTDRAQREVATHLAECWDCSRDAEILRLIKHCLRQRRTPAGDNLALLRL